MLPMPTLEMPRESCRGRSALSFTYSRRSGLPIPAAPGSSLVALKGQTTTPYHLRAGLPANAAYLCSCSTRSQLPTANQGLLQRIHPNTELNRWYSTRPRPKSILEPVNLMCFLRSCSALERLNPRSATYHYTARNFAQHRTSPPCRCCG